MLPRDFLLLISVTAAVVLGRNIINNQYSICMPIYSVQIFHVNHLPGFWTLMQYCNAIKTRTNQHSLLLEGENSCSDGEALTPVLVTMSRYDGDHSMMYAVDHGMTQSQML